MLTAITAALAAAVVVLSLLDLWAYAQKRFDRSARVITAEIVAIVGLLVISIAGRDWWLTATWVGCVALNVLNLRRTSRKREAHTA